MYVFLPEYEQLWVNYYKKKKKKGFDSKVKRQNN